MAICTEADQLIKAFAQALIAGDVEALTDLYEEDATLYNTAASMGYIDGKYRGKAAIRRSWQNAVERREVLDWEPIEREERVVGDYAFGHMVMWSKSRPRGTTVDPIASRARSTEIMHRSADGGWRFIVDHASVVTSPAAT